MRYSGTACRYDENRCLWSAGAAEEEMAPEPFNWQEYITADPHICHGKHASRVPAPRIGHSGQSDSGSQ